MTGELLEDTSISYKVSEETSSTDNRLIYGDNLPVIKALEQEFTNKIKCIYIDPPYNTGKTFAHYTDNTEQVLWLAFMRERLDVLWNLLSPDGSMWISIDDDSMPHLRVLMDELVGRNKFIAQNVWRRTYAQTNNSTYSVVHEYVLLYAKDRKTFKKSRNLLQTTNKQQKLYANTNNDPRGPYQRMPILAPSTDPAINRRYEIIAPNGKVHRPPEERGWRYTQASFDKLKAAELIYYGRDGNAVPTRIRYLSGVKGICPSTWWPWEEVGHTDEAKREMWGLFGKVNAFNTPKPERLLYRIISIATNPGDLVLDAFAGSGTTGAVAHKIGRSWIMIESGEHCHTLTVPRLKKVIDGLDTGGISKSVNWCGGGSFRYFQLVK